MPSYARWLHVRERILIERGLVTAEELANPDGPIAKHELAGFQPASPREVLSALRRDTSSELPAKVPASFAVGDPVRARNEHPLGHTRAPGYVRGRSGTIDRDHGVHVFQDDLPPGARRRPQHLYSVMFTGRELWGGRGHARDRVFVDLWDEHLEPAP
jgi:nitrile hydratase